MPRVTWPLSSDGPDARVTLEVVAGQLATFDLTADPGAGAASSAFGLFLLESS